MTIRARCPALVSITLLAIVVVTNPTAVLACDTWVALADATADGSIILAKNSDRPPMEAQPLVHFAHKNHARDETVTCTYIKIPQVQETYENIGSKIWWTYNWCY